MDKEKLKEIKSLAIKLSSLVDELLKEPEPHFKSYDERLIASQSQDPERCLESEMEKQIYTLFRDNDLLPQMQYQIGKYFVDFAFPDIKLAIEYDGKQHRTRAVEDCERRKQIKYNGFDIFSIRKYRNYKIYAFFKGQQYKVYDFNTLEELMNCLSENIKEFKK